MSKTYKDKPGYLNGIKKEKEDLSQKYLRHRNRDDEEWKPLREKKSSKKSNYYHCIERKMPIFYDDMDRTEELIDSLDDFIDKETDAA